MSEPCHEDGAVIELSEHEWQQQVLTALQLEGQRLTAPRQAIVRWIAAQHTPFSAEALTSALSPQPASVGRATAYRAVEWLRDQGWLARVQTERGDYTYARTLPGHHHHAVCTRCGALLMFEGCAMIDSLTSMLEAQGFQVQGHIVELFGLCATCQAKK
ncbi:MAG: transcriptional repressor [Chloroflexia bacterium]|nr:transcriptional repressor [Chloroflexia bacterium]